MSKNRNCWGIKGKNDEQKEAITALVDPSIDLVILEGVAGSGKTLLAVAAALEQILETHTYKELIFTRAPIGVGADMGFLPGDEGEKLAPWCQGLYDNLEFLLGDNKITESVIKSKVKIKAMQFMRGRSLMNKYLIIDEVQNMSIQELKVLLTRAGEGTKIVCMGDISQIDNKKLNKNNNALTSLVSYTDFTNADFVKYINLPAGVRSRVCAWASGIDGESI